MLEVASSFEVRGYFQVAPRCHDQGMSREIIKIQVSARYGAALRGSNGLLHVMLDCQWSCQQDEVPRSTNLPQKRRVRTVRRKQGKHIIIKLKGF